MFSIWHSLFELVEELLFGGSRALQLLTFKRLIGRLGLTTG